MVEHLADELVQRHGRLVDGVFRVAWDALWDDAAQNHEDRCTANEVDPALLDSVGEAWTERLASSFEPALRTLTTPEFRLVAEGPRQELRPLLRVLSEARTRVLHLLPGIAVAPSYRLPVVALGNPFRLDRYVTPLLPEDGPDLPLAGVFVSDGLPHLVVGAHRGNTFDTVLHHELTHAYVSHIRLPVWLNEGIATSIERAVDLHSQPMTEEEFDAHVAHWNATAIQRFWSGSCWNGSDEEVSFAYGLARMLVIPLMEHAEPFARFANAATWEDGGEAAAHAVYGRSLGDLPAALLGAGDWAPRPDAWNRDADADDAVENGA